MMHDFSIIFMSLKFDTVFLPMNVPHSRSPKAVDRILICVLDKTMSSVRLDIL
jgi:hypothetical protein